MRPHTPENDCGTQTARLCSPPGPHSPECETRSPQSLRDGVVNMLAGPRHRNYRSSRFADELFLEVGCGVLFQVAHRSTHCMDASSN